MWEYKIDVSTFFIYKQMKYDFKLHFYKVFEKF